MATRVTYSPTDELGNPWPVRTVEELREALERGDDPTILDCLVDIVNRSPHSSAEWAESLGIEHPKFVEVCHRKDPVDDDFRSKVREFFAQ